MSAIAAADLIWAIGRGNDLIYRISADLKRFRRLTLGRTVVMGHNTLLSLPGQKPLEGRTNIVLTRDTNLKIPGAVTVHSLRGFFDFAQAAADTEEIKEIEEIFVIGGESVYRQLLPYCGQAYITRIYAGELDADRFFPDLDSDPHWSGEAESEPAEEKGIGYRYFRYTNSAPLRPGEAL
ncbi:MAG: dihydrofolate reductase [Eubacteriales bacterium]|nr:dihydrofolate reductase [Eubacteriales bacterium]